METVQWERIKAKLDAAGVEYQQLGRASIYFRDPDGTRLELIHEPLGHMSGARVL
jgi:catechol 2,3-dioxygenase-like lactoylglutathione lyase family enzyme